MRSNRLCFDGLDGRFPFTLPTEAFVLHSLGGHISSMISSLVDSQMHGSSSLLVPGSIALQETFRNIARFGGGFVLRLRSRTGLYQDEKWSGSSCNQEASGCKLEKLVRSISGSMAAREYLYPRSLDEVRGSILKQLTKEAEKLWFLPFLSMGGVLVPAFGTISWKMLEGPLGGAALKEFVPVDQLPCESENKGCSSLTVPDLPRKRYAVEPRTGIEFPVMLETIPDGVRCSSLTSKGTTIDFHQTSVGNLITEIGGNCIGVVKRKELCSGFFDMYIGDLPVPEQTKEEIGQNIAGILGRCAWQQPSSLENA